MLLKKYQCQKCQKKFSRFKVYQKHIDRCNVRLKKCECGCENTFYGDVKRFIVGQHTEERKLKTSLTRKKYAQMNPEKRILTGKKISATKNSPEGKIRVQNAIIKAYSKPRKKPVRKQPSPKIIINCLFCNKEIITHPCRKGVKKYCSRECRIASRKGKQHVNWNPKSSEKSGNRGVCGKYKNIVFRSSYEL